MDNTFDKIFYPQGERIGGIDEAGVSDIAGPLVAACVILPKLDAQKDDVKIFDVDDSKKIPEKYRTQHAEVIWQTATAIGIGEVHPGEIDYLKRPHATGLAMMRAIVACKSISRNKKVLPDFLLIDGQRAVPTNIPQHFTRDADQKSLCVAAASVVAKVYRDEIMKALHDRFPMYGWNNNKGYPCEEHFKGLDKHGIQIGVHRTKYWPFVPNTMHEEGRGWDKRRKNWRRITSEKLGKELGGNLWTTNPPLWTPSKNSKSTQRKGATSESGSKTVKKKSKTKPTKSASL